MILLYSSCILVKRNILEEAIATFLVNLTPQNLILPTKSNLPKNIDGMYYITRALQALGEPFYDPNHNFFVSRSLQDAH